VVLDGLTARVQFEIENFGHARLLMMHHHQVVQDVDCKSAIAFEKQNVRDFDHPFPTDLMHDHLRAGIQLGDLLDNQEMQTTVDRRQNHIPFQQFCCLKTENKTFFTHYQAIDISHPGSNHAEKQI
jgi:hypothetical protein